MIVGLLYEVPSSVISKYRVTLTVSSLGEEKAKKYVPGQMPDNRTVPLVSIVSLRTIFEPGRRPSRSSTFIGPE